MPVLRLDLSCFAPQRKKKFHHFLNTLKKLHLSNWQGAHYACSNVKELIEFIHATDLDYVDADIYMSYSNKHQSSPMAIKSIVVWTHAKICPFLYMNQKGYLDLWTLKPKSRNVWQFMWREWYGQSSEQDFINLWAFINLPQISAVNWVYYDHVLLFWLVTQCNHEWRITKLWFKFGAEIKTKMYDAFWGQGSATTKYPPG